MIQGTGSGVGKSLIVAGLCRLFSENGIRVAPFKAQNMALNSFVTREGGEIGRAQALQAEAAGIEPSIYMNPILLKASGEKGSQVILLGKVHSNMKATDYYSFKNKAWEIATEAWEILKNKYELIIIEGAGSPAEINLMDKEIVNMRVARHTDSPVILIGDIDRGGVFASLYGTVTLLGNDAKYIRAFIINKFRGDIEILKPGNMMIHEKTGIPVIGTLPYITNLRLHEEDGVSLKKYRMDEFNNIKIPDPIKITVLRLKYIANFTDYDPFLYEPDVELLYSLSKEDILSSDLVIIPGSKNTIKDLTYLKEITVDKHLNAAIKKNILVIGICGGYQMLGKELRDPYNVESKEEKIKGLGFLDTLTIFDKSKTTCQIEAKTADNIPFIDGNFYRLHGYEIHMGRTEGNTGIFSINRLNSLEKNKNFLDGSKNGNVWGTYIHGIFDNDLFRRSLINNLRIKKGLEPEEIQTNYSEMKNKALDEFAGIIRENIDMDYVFKLIK